MGGPQDMERGVNAVNVLEQNLARISMRDALKDQLRSMASSGRIALRAQGAGFVMRVDGRSLYDEQAPVERAAHEVFALQGERKQDVVAFFGFGFGIHAEFLEKRFDAPIAVFEPDVEVLHAALCARPMNLERTFVETNFGYFHEYVESRLMYGDMQVVAASMAAYREAYPQQFSRFAFVVQQSLDNAVIRFNTMSKGLSWSEHEIANLHRVATLPQVIDLGRHLAGVPGIFVGAGPSLADNGELLRRVQDRALIVAANSALKPLARLGVVPHIVTVLEAKDLRYQFEGVPQLDRVTVAATPNAHPGFYSLPVRHTMTLLARPTPVHDWITAAWPERRAVPVGGSVAMVAFGLLVEMGCDPIVAVGMDLAFRGEETHAAGSDHAALRVRVDPVSRTVDVVVEDANARLIDYDPSQRGQVLARREMVTCTAWGGTGEVATYPVFNSYRAWLEGAAATWAADRTLINATEGGARIHGFVERPLADVVDAWCALPQVDPVAALDALARAHEPPDLRPLHEALARERAGAAEVAALAAQAKETARRAERLLKARRIAQARTALEELEQTERRLGALTRRSRMLNQVAQHAADALRLKRKEDEHPDPLVQTQRSLVRSQHLFEVIVNGALQVQRLVDSGAAALRGA